MIPGILNAATKPVKEVRMDDGTVYPWTQKRPPTKAEIDQLKAYHKQEGITSKKVYADVKDTFTSDPKPKNNIKTYFKAQSEGPKLQGERPANVSKEAKKQTDASMRQMSRQDEKGNRLDRKGQPIETWKVKHGVELSNRMQQIIGEAIKPVTDLVTEIVLPIPGLANRVKPVANSFTAGVINTPVNIAANAGNMLFAEDNSPENIIRSAFNIAVDTVPVKAPGFVKNLLKGVDTGFVDDALKTAEGSGIPAKSPRTKYKLDQARTSTPKAPKATPNTPESPEAPQKPVEGQESATTGVSHAEVDVLREKMNWTPRNPTQTKSDAQLAADAKKFDGKERTLADRVMDDEDGKVTLADEEAVALGKKLSTLKQEMMGAKAKNDADAFDLADEEAQRIADALDTSGTRQGRAFRARRFLFDGQEDAWTINRRAKKANQGQDLDIKQQAHLDKTIADLEAANTTLKAERDAAVNNLNLFKDATKSKRSKGPLTAERRRAEALNSLKRLGIPVAEDAPKVASTTGGMRSKQSGAINIPEGSTEQVARAVRGLVRSYADQGLNDWDKVLGKLKQDLPGIDEDQALYILSGKYKVATVEADLARKTAYEYLDGVKAQAIYKTKPFYKKVAHHAFELFNAGQRGAQTTLDNSLALIQSKNVLASRPGTWLKGVGHSFQAMLKKDPIRFAKEHKIEIEKHPLYAKAVQAKLSLSDVDGSFSKQEEYFAGQLHSKVPLLSHSKAAATVLGNTMRFDLFRKMAANLPANAPAEAYSDIAQYVNVLTGRGHGDVAQWLGGKVAGSVSYAPRFYWSKLQHNSMQPIWAAKTAVGRKEALKGYAMQMAGYGAALSTAMAFGWEVDLDPRSATFGKASKDGLRFDLFYQQSEGVRLMAQMFYGRISQKGNYTPPGDFGDYTYGDWIESKSSPLVKTIMRAGTGKTFDFEEGKSRDVVASDYWGSFIPLSLQEMYKNQDRPLTFPASFMGAGIDKPKPKSRSKKPIPPLITDPIVRKAEDFGRNLRHSLIGR